jgi:CheY-like chemotaxis protein
MLDPMTVLYAEDLDEDILIMERAFQMSHTPLKLQTVRDGRQAIQYLSGVPPFTSRAQHPLPFLLLLDLKMPAIGGLEVLEWIRQHPVLVDMTIYVLSSSMRREDKEAAECLGAKGFWVKKTNFTELLDLIRKFDSPEFRNGQLNIAG